MQLDDADVSLLLGDGRRGNSGALLGVGSDAGVVPLLLRRNAFLGQRPRDF